MFVMIIKDTLCIMTLQNDQGFYTKTLCMFD